MAKTALGRDPSTKGTKTRAKTHRARGGVWVDEQGYRVDGYGRRYPGQKEPYEKPKDTAPKTNKAPAPPPGPQMDPYTNAPQSPWDQLTPEQRDAEIEQGVSGLMRGIMDQAKPFQPGSYADQMNAARQNVMREFEAQNADVFKRQEADFYQRAAEQGLDPNNPGYAALYKQEVTDRQDRARQSAMRSAEDAAYNVQQQGFNQAYQQFLAPGEQFGQFSPVWGQGQQSRADMLALQEKAKREFEMIRYQEQQANKRAEIAARASRSGGGGGGGPSEPTLYDKYRAGNIEGGYPQNNGSNIGNNALVGGVTGAGNQFINRLNPQNTKKQA